MEVLKLFAPYGPGWLGGVLLALIAFYFGKQFLAEYKVQNERKAHIDLKREERKQAEVDERAQRDRERSQMEGRIAAQMERSNTLIEGMKTLRSRSSRQMTCCTPIWSTARRAARGWPRRSTTSTTASTSCTTRRQADRSNQMTEIQAGLTVATVLVVPYIVQAIKTKAMTGSVARWTAIAVSAGCGALTAMAGGVPTDPSAWVTSIFACVGGVQVAYAAFKSVGITDKWLDALLALGDIKED